MEWIGAFCFLSGGYFCFYFHFCPSLCYCLSLFQSVLELFGFVRDIFRATSKFNLPIKATDNFRNFYCSTPYPGPLLMKKDGDFQ